MSNHRMKSVSNAEKERRRKLWVRFVNQQPCLSPVRASASEKSKFTNYTRVLFKIKKFILFFYD